MSDLQESQFPLDRVIHREVLRSVPTSWLKATLQADSIDTGSGSTQMTVRIDGAGQPGIALVSDELQDKLRAQAVRPAFGELRSAVSDRFRCPSRGAGPEID